MYRARRGVLSCVVVWLCVHGVALADTVWYVDSGALGLGDGQGWDDAFVLLEDALDAAESGDEIRIAGGTYYPDGSSGDRDLSYQIHAEVVLLGGFAGGGHVDPGLRDIDTFPTILSGDIGELGSFGDNSHHVIKVDAGGDGSTLDGLVIESGQADGAYPNDSGGGLWLGCSSLTMRDCTFRSNRANSGGAIYISSGASPLAEGCTFLRNEALMNGGAIAGQATSSEFRNCLFDWNIAAQSGGACHEFYSSGVYRDCIFTDNVAELSGGAAYVLMGTPTFVDCSFRGNMAISDTSLTEGGGSLFVDSADAAIVGCMFYDNLSSRHGGAVTIKQCSTNIASCHFIENLASNDGGAVYVRDGTPRIDNCVFTGNLALSRGGGLTSQGGSPAIANCTLANNRAFTGGGGVYGVSADPELTSCILWSNTGPGGQTEDAQVDGQSSGIVLNYCDVQGWSGVWGGEGNSGADPMLVDSLGADGVAGTLDDDFNLQFSSPCVDGGDPDYNAQGVTTDPDGRPRVLCGRVDVGAYEGGQGDFDCDRDVDLDDVSYWPECVTGPGAFRDATGCEIVDFNLDGFIDLRDFSTLQSMFLGS